MIIMFVAVITAYLRDRVHRPSTGGLWASERRAGVQRAADLAALAGA